MQRDHLHQIMEAGIQAPSGDNTQPWTFRLIHAGVLLSIVPKVPETLFDVAHEALYISAGAVLENMRFMSQALGYASTVRYFPLKGDELCVAEIKFKANHEIPKIPNAMEIIKARCTNRRPYHLHQKIPPAVYAELEREVSRYAGHKLILLKRFDPKFKRLVRITCQMTNMRFEIKSVFEDFFRQIHFPSKSDESILHGMDARTFEMDPFTLRASKFLSTWERQRIVIKLGLNWTPYLFIMLRFWASQALGLIVVASHAPKDVVQGGESMLRLWRLLTKHGVSMQPMDDIPVFMTSLTLRPNKFLNAKQREEVKKYQREVLRILNVQAHQAMILLFRVGYAKPPSFRALRRPLQTFIKGESK